MLTKMVSMPRARAVARTFCAFLIALFFSICEQRFRPQTPLGSHTLFCQCSISSADSGDTRLDIVLSPRPLLALAFWPFATASLHRCKTSRHSTHRQRNQLVFAGTVRS
jgi:hypothetical protein